MKNKLPLLILFTFLSINTTYCQHLVDTPIEILGGGGGQTSFITNHHNPWIWSTKNTQTLPYPFANGDLGHLVIQPRTSSLRDILFITGNGDDIRMSIKGNGYVGIGTNNPSSKFHINGNSSTYAKISNTGGNSKLILGAVNNRNIIYSRKSDDTPQILKFQVNNENNFVIGTNGYIGIGIVNPSSKLDVKGDVKASSYSVINTNYNSKLSSNALQFSRNGVSYIDNKNSNGSIAIRTGGVTNVDLLIKSNGNVGIGTTTPGAKLHIKDGGQQLKLLEGSNTSGYSLSLGVNDNGVNILNNSSIRGFNFGNNNGNLLKISYSGNAALYGKLEAKEIKVTQTPTADFVFEKNYNLPSLGFIEEHIKEKKHLPEIASAKEMKKNGINIGAFQIQLLQKIEELTLYTIEQEKEINLQKEMVSDFKKRLEKLEKK